MDMLKDTERKQLVNRGESSCIYINRWKFTSIFSDKEKKDALAVRQIGLTSLFISQSATEMKQPELLSLWDN